MKAIGIKVLKNKLSEYLRFAASGERVLVTDRDVVIAEIGPPAGGTASSVSDVALMKMIREGIMTPATNPRASMSPPKRLGQRALVDDLRRDRDSR
jgi:antitoxin (DNA-binding transcriptional repressor) of toxin-antitoxin stability system